MENVHAVCKHIACLFRLIHHRHDSGHHAFNFILSTNEVGLHPFHPLFDQFQPLPEVLLPNFLCPTDIHRFFFMPRTIHFIRSAGYDTNTSLISHSLFFQGLLCLFYSGAGNRWQFHCPITVAVRDSGGLSYAQHFRSLVKKKNAQAIS